MAFQRKVTGVVAESGEEVQMDLLPGATAQDILRTMGVRGRGYELSSGQGHEAFASHDDVYAQLPAVGPSSRVMLVASRRPEVGG